MGYLQESEHIKFRNLYYISGLIIIIVTAGILSIPLFTSVRQEYSRKVEQLSEGIRNQKSNYIKSVVLEKISDIKQLTKIYRNESAKKAKLLCYVLRDLHKRFSKPDILKNRFSEYLNNSGIEYYDFVISSKAGITASSLQSALSIEDENVFPVIEQLISTNGFVYQIMQSKKIHG